MEIWHCYDKEYRFKFDDKEVVVSKGITIENLKRVLEEFESGEIARADDDFKRLKEEARKENRNNR